MSVSGTSSLISGLRSFGAFAEPDVTDLGERADGLRLTLLDRLHAGDEGRAHRPQSGQQDSKFALRGRYIRDFLALTPKLTPSRGSVSTKWDGGTIFGRAE